jgi:Family of unknown function (DUF6262)
MNDNLAAVETACRELATASEPVTFTTIAERTGISRTTLYRNPELRAIIEEHRHHSHDPRTLTGLTAEIGHLRTAVEALADRVRHQEERLRRLETPPPRRKAN